MLLDIQHLKVEFYDRSAPFAAVKDFSLQMGEGEVVGIVGESGSGKSMTAHALMGLIQRSQVAISGKALFDGADLLAMSRDELRQYQGKELSIIFQEPMTSLDPAMKIGRQVEDALRVHTKLARAVRRERALEAMALAGLPEPEKLYGCYPHQLSGGMRQRVMIAMGLICHPKLLIADEPTTALDVTIQAQILELMKDLQKKTHMGIIFITHNLGVVAEICDKVSVMYAGRIVEQGPVDDIFYRPSHPYTVGLLRSMPRVDAESYERLIPIEGTPVDMLNPPEGCPFAPRCEHCMKICLKQMPPYVEIGEDHRSACWLRVQECKKGEKLGAEGGALDKTAPDTKAEEGTDHE